MEKPARCSGKLESGGGGVGRVENSLWLGAGQWVPLTHRGCLDESAHLGVGVGLSFHF